MEDHDKICAFLEKENGFKIKSKLKHTGIHFTKGLLVKNILHDEAYFVIYTSENETFKFKTKESFLDNFIQFVMDRLDKLRSEYAEIDKQSNAMFADETFIHNWYESVSIHGYACLELLNSLREYRGDKKPE